MTKEKTTIKTDFFDNFYWKKLPIENDYITIIFCLDKYKDNDKYDFMKNIENDKIKKALTYILNIMPYKCIVNVDSYNNFIEYKNEINKDDTGKKLNELKTKLKNNTNLEFLEKKMEKINNKKTYLFTYTSEQFIENNLKNIFDISINKHFNETHKVCVGELENIPKTILSVADYIFFENKDILNKYFEMLNHNIRIQTSNAELFLLDKCNYEHYQLFNFNKHLVTK